MGVKISELPDADSVGADDLVLISDVADNNAKKTTGGQIVDNIEASKFAENITNENSFAGIGNTKISATVGFIVSRTSGNKQVVPDSTIALIDFNEEVFNSGHFDMTENKFVAPQDGVYLFSLLSSFEQTDYMSQWSYINVNMIDGNPYTRGYSTYSGTGREYHNMITDMLKLTAGDEITFTVYHNYGADNTLRDSIYLYATGFLIGGV